MNQTRTKIESIANITIDIPFAQPWTLTAGARYSSESKDGVSETLLAPAFLANPAGRNLGDERFCSYAGTLPLGTAQCLVNEPRTYGITLRASFE